MQSNDADHEESAQECGRFKPPPGRLPDFSHPLLEFCDTEPFPVVWKLSKALLKAQGELNVEKRIPAQGFKRILGLDNLAKKFVLEQRAHIIDLGCRAIGSVMVRTLLRQELICQNTSLHFSRSGERHGIDGHQVQRISGDDPHALQSGSRSFFHAPGVRCAALQGDQNSIAALKVRNLCNRDLRALSNSGSNTLLKFVGRDLDATEINQIVCPTVKKQIAPLHVAQVVRLQPALSIQQIVPARGVYFRSCDMRPANPNAVIRSDLDFCAPHGPTDRLKQIVLGI